MILLQIEKVKIYVDKNGDKQVIHDFNRVYGQLKDQGHLVDKVSGVFN